jgi:cobaltochelatase CobT
MLKKHHKRLIYSVLETVARGLSSKYGIRVIFEGNKAYTDGKKIVLPQLSSELSEDDIEDIRAYLYHEVSHSLYTNFDVFKKAQETHGQALKIMLNYFCDIRIERLIAKQYPGTETPLITLRNKLTKKALGRLQDGEPFFIFCFALAEDMRGNRHPEFESTPTGALAYELSKDFTPRLNGATSTTELLTVCLDLIKKIKELAPNKSPEDETGTEISNSSGEKSSAQNGSTPSQPGQENTSKNESPVDDNAASEVNPSEKKDNLEITKQAAKDILNSIENLNKTKDKSSDHGEQNDDGQGIGEQSENEEQGDEDTSGLGTMEDFINKDVLSGLTKDSNGARSKNGRNYHDHRIEITSGTESLPFTTQFDEEINFSGRSEYDEGYSFIRSKILSVASGVRNKIERVLASNSIERKTSLQKRGRLDRRKLARLATDGDFDRPFFKLDSIESQKTAVTILIDLSGSMSGMKIKHAQLAASAMAEALTGLQIHFEVLGFECLFDNRVSNFTKNQKSARFNRTTERLSHKIFKDFKTSSLSGIAAIKAGNNNADGESVMWAAKRLTERPEKRKILIVLSDGNPVADGDQSILYSDLKTKIERIEASGIECVGIGITTTDVKKFYKDWVILNSVSELAAGCGEALAKILLKNQK